MTEKVVQGHNDAIERLVGGNQTNRGNRMVFPSNTDSRGTRAHHASGDAVGHCDMDRDEHAFGDRIRSAASRVQGFAKKAAPYMSQAADMASQAAQGTKYGNLANQAKGYVDRGREITGYAYGEDVRDEHAFGDRIRSAASRVQGFAKKAAPYMSQAADMASQAAQGTKYGNLANQAKGYVDRGREITGYAYGEDVRDEHAFGDRIRSAASRVQGFAKKAAPYMSQAADMASQAAQGTKYGNLANQAKGYVDRGREITGYAYGEDVRDEHAFGDRVPRLKNAAIKVAGGIRKAAPYLKKGFETVSKLAPMVGLNEGGHVPYYNDHEAHAFGDRIHSAASKVQGFAKKAAPYVKTGLKIASHVAPGSIAKVADRAYSGMDKMGYAAGDFVESHRSKKDFRQSLRDLKKQREGGHVDEDREHYGTGGAPYYGN